MKYIQTEGGSYTGKEYEIRGECNECDKSNCDPIYDACTKTRHWGWFCTDCWNELCDALGVGSGQKYKQVTK